MLKKYLGLLIVFLSILVIGCKDNSTKGLKYDKISASHLVYDDKATSYILVKSKPSYIEDIKNIVSSITIYSNLLSEQMTGRYFNYYQVDWTTDNNKIDQYYHIFELDANKRFYAQNFFPYNKIDGDFIKSVDVKFEYEYDNPNIEEKIYTEVTYHEDMLTIDKSEIEDLKFKEEIDLLDVDIIFTSNDIEDYDRYKINLYLSDNIINEKGHLDIQSYILIDDFYRFVGIYHYQTNNGDYISVSDEIIDKRFTKGNQYIYFIIKYYTENETMTYYLKKEVK